MPLEVKYHKAPENTGWLVKQFETIKFGGQRVILDKFIPREDASLVFHFSGLPFMEKPVFQRLHPFFIAPLCPKANLLRLDEPSDSFIVTCKPTVLSAVFNLSLAPDPHVFVPLPEDKFYPLWKSLARLKSTEERIRYFSDFVNSIMPQPYIPDDIDLFYNMILESEFMVPLQEIMDSFRVSERTMQRKFHKRLGVSPKTLFRIVRINHLWEKINNGKIDYQDLVFYGNYFDQTHFIKDFKAIIGETPDSFFKRNLNIVKVLSGKKPAD